MFIAIGPNVWGRGETKEEALKKAAGVRGARKLPKYAIYQSDDPAIFVTGMGHLCYDSKYDRPVLVDSKGLPKEEEVAA
jgi:hypothetical protein